MRMHMKMNITTATRPYILTSFVHSFVNSLVYSLYIITFWSCVYIHIQINIRINVTKATRHYILMLCACDAEDVSLHIRRCYMCISNALVREWRG